MHTVYILIHINIFSLIRIILGAYSSMEGDEDIDRLVHIIHFIYQNVCVLVSNW